MQSFSILTKKHTLQNLNLIKKHIFQFSFSNVTHKHFYFCKKTLSKNNNQIEINKSICLAQKQINLSSQKLAKESDLMIVVGGKNSSNSVELFKNVSYYCPSIFIEDINTYKTELKNNNITINKNTHIGITAGASTLKEELIELKNLIKNDLK